METRRLCQAVDSMLNPVGNGHRSNVAILSEDIHDGPVIVAALKMLAREVSRFGLPQSTPK
jgi:hypothetical protein